MKMALNDALFIKCNKNTLAIIKRNLSRSIVTAIVIEIQKLFHGAIYVIICRCINYDIIIKACIQIIICNTVRGHMDNKLN